MEQDRLDEFAESMEECANYPVELNDLELRLRKRIHHSVRKRFVVSITSTAAVFLLFVLVINTQTAMADAILRIPVLGTLAEFVSFDKGLQNAVKNEYAKEVDLIANNNGYTLGIPYIIADSKRLVLFIQLPQNAQIQANEMILLDITKIINSATGEKFSEYTASTSYVPEEDGDNNRLNYISIRSVDAPIPKELQIYVSVRRESFTSPDVPKPSKPSDLFEPSSDNKIEQLGNFVFDLHLDDYSEPKVTVLNKDVLVEGQTIRINSVTQYPTGTEISVNLPDHSNFIVNEVTLTAIDAKGNKWDNPGGVVSIGPNTENRILYYLEGDYFNSSPLDKIQITGISLLKKSDAVITIDLKNKTMTPEVGDFYIKSIERSGNKAYITFGTNITEYFGIFSSEYKDTDGNSYSYNTQSMTQSTDGADYHFALIWPEDNIVILTRSRAPLTELEKPVEIKLNK
jgi:hypothetical protein